MLTPQEEKIVGKWRATGLLRDLGGREAYKVAQVLENQANFMARERTADPDDETRLMFLNIIFPTIMRILTSPLLTINWDVVTTPCADVDVGYGMIVERAAVTQRLRTPFSIKRLKEIREKSYYNLDAEVEYSQELAASFIQEFNFRGKDLHCTYFHTLIVGPYKIHDDSYGLMTRGIDVHKPKPGWRPKGYKKMKVIFLDIDGVMNIFTADYDAKGFPWSGYEQSAVKNLNDIINDTGAKLVISSTWRLHYTKEEMQEGLSRWGVEGEVIDMTGIFGGPVDYSTMHDFSASSRASEIYDWLADHADVKAYVSLDDIDMRMHGLEQVKTSPYEGLTERDAKLAIAKLKKNDAQSQ